MALLILGLCSVIPLSLSPRGKSAKDNREGLHDKSRRNCRGCSDLY